MKLCSIEGCGNKHYAHSLCSKHWQKWRSYGDPLAGTERIVYSSVEERFDAKWVFTMYCWNWSAAKNTKGYGDFRVNRVTNRAHRYSYERWVGVIPSGMQVDHLCHNRLCVNPNHLRIVTHKQNQENRFGASVRSKTGFRGVYFNKDENTFYAQVVDGPDSYSKHGFKDVGSANMWAIEKRKELYTHNTIDRNFL